MIQEVFFETVKIIIIVLVLMVAIEWLQIHFKDKIKKHLTKNKKNQIVGSSLLGIVPGCIGTFFIVSLYSHGLVGFGALAAVMLATAGDEAFVMLAMIPKTAILIFAICALLAIIGGFLGERIAKKIKLKRAKPCPIIIHRKEKVGHFFKEHIWQHIIKKHIPKLFLWIFFTLLIIQLLIQHFDLAAILPQNKLPLIVLAALIGIIPESGPHLIFLTLFAQGMIPFSVLLTSSLVQDGHGLLPLLSYSVKDAINVKVFNVIFGLLIGLLLLLIGI